MKHLLPLLLLLTIAFSSCEGPMGPVGPVGPEGEPGDDFLGVTFEFTGSFTASNDYQLLFNFSDNGYVPYESDVILVYLLWETTDYDYWRQLPQATYFNSGAILQYNFDFTADIDNNTIVDMAVFLDGDIDLSTLSPEYALNQTFRVVVVPSEFLATVMDANEINNVLKAENIEIKDLGTFK